MKVLAPTIHCLFFCILRPNKKAVVFFILFSLLIDTYAQKKSASFSFDDNFGNTISFYQIKNLPKPFNTLFLKSNLNGKSFDKYLLEKPFRFHYHITIIEIIVPEQEFEFRVLSYPKIKSDDTIVPNRGYSRYRVKLKKNDDVLKVELIEKVAMEI